MLHVLSSGMRLLEEFARSSVLLAFDFDGTLAPVVPRPAAAQLRQRTRVLLSEVARRFPSVVISGRSSMDVRSRLRGIPLVQAIGNHGLEPKLAHSSFERTVSGWIAELRRGLGGLRGVSIEDKRFSLAVHYRPCRTKRRALARLQEIVSTFRDCRRIDGKQVVNLLPLGAPHKGVALERARAEARCDTAIYVGDDESDEDVFGLDQPGQLLAIRVGRSTRSAARYCLRSQAEIDELLSVLLSLRAHSATRRMTV